MFSLGDELNSTGQFAVGSNCTLSLFAQSIARALFLGVKCLLVLHVHVWVINVDHRFGECRHHVHEVYIVWWVAVWVGDFAKSTHGTQTPSWPCCIFSNGHYPCACCWDAGVSQAHLLQDLVYEAADRAQPASSQVWNLWGQAQMGLVWWCFLIVRLVLLVYFSFRRSATVYTRDVCIIVLHVHSLILHRWNLGKTNVYNLIASMHYNPKWDVDTVYI